jgi:hypothetical protein
MRQQGYANLREHHENDVRAGLNDSTKLLSQKGRVNRSELLGVRVFSLGLCAVLLFSVVSMPLGRNLFQVDSSSLSGLPLEFINPKDFINTSNDKIQSLDARGQPFITNEGQQDAEVLYYTDIFAGTVYITKDGLTYALRNAASNTIQSGDDSSIAGVAIKESFVGSNPLQPQGQDQTQTRINYFVGDQSNWKANIPAFNKVSFGQVWNGIDVDLVAANNNVEKIFTVAPGADFKDIQVALEGIISISVNSQGELVLGTELGEVSLTKPVAFQEIGMTGSAVEVSYAVLDSDKYGFAVGDGYDPHYPLIIDPLLASTFIGGADNEGNSLLTPLEENEDMGIAFDSLGNVFVAGLTSGTSDDYPTTVGPYGSPSGVLPDVVVSKFNSDLSLLLASAVIGGSELDEALAIAMDSAGNPHITGRTNSTNFPITLDGNGIYGGGLSDVFVSALSNDLGTLEFSTYIGGSGGDQAHAIAINAIGVVYVVGTSTSADYPTTPGAFDTTKNGGGNNQNAIVTSISGSTITGSTFLGGTNDAVGRGVAISSTGNVYVTGFTLATNFPIVGGYDTDKIFGVNQHETFVAAFNSDLTGLLASTYHGNGITSGEHTTPFGIALDSADNVYIAGYTASDTFPTTSGAYDTTREVGDDDAYISVLPSSLATLTASTVIGGASGERIRGLALTGSGVYVIASGGSYPTTPGAFNEGANNAYVSKVSLDLSTLIASTSIGGSSTDVLSAIGISSGDVYVAGWTRSINYPTTAGAYDTTKAGVPGSFDFVVSKLTADLSADSPVSDTTPPNHPPLSDLVSWYRAEGNFVDSAGDNDGSDETNDSGVEFVLGRVGDAFQFDNDWVEIVNDPTLNFGTGSFTVDAWINSNDNSQQANMIVHGASGENTPIEAGWELGTGPGSAPYVFVGDHIIFDIRDSTGQAAGRPIVSAPAPSEGEWHHIAAVVDRENDLLLLYIDGQLADSDPIPPAFGSLDNNGNPAIGAQNRGGAATGGSPSGFFSGSIDEAAFHSRALSASEIQATYDVGTVLINNGDATTTTPDVTVSMACDDSGSGCSDIELVFENIDANNPVTVDSIPIDVTGESNPPVETLDAVETGPDTAIFVLELVLTDDGDGDTIQFNDGDQITATGTFFDSAAGTKSIDVVFTDGDGNSVTQSDIIELVAGAQPTSLTLNPIRDVTATTGFTVSGELVNDDTGEGISGQQIDFTGTGVTGSLQSVMTEGVTFTGAIDLVSCPTPATPTPTTCTKDDIGTDDTTSDNVVLHLGVGGKIRFPASTVTVKLYLQDMNSTPFKYIVEEGNGSFQPEASSAGALSPIVPKVEIVSGFSVGGDPNGIKEITITEITGGTSVGVAAVLTGNPDGLPFEQHQINFEEFTPGPQTSPFTVNPGFYFSTGFAQNIDEEGLEITAHFAGTSGLAASDSTTETYNVLANTAGIGGEGAQNLGGAVGTSITTLDCNTDVGSVDTDSDGICDLWETAGITLGGANYPLAGAVVGQRDIFVEIDCMTGFCPTTSGSGINNNIQTIINVFAAEGFTLHITIDETNLAVFDPLHVWTDTTPAVLDDFDSIKKAKFGTSGERSGGTLGSGNDFLEAKAQVYHYGLFAKNINTGANIACGPSGQAELRGNDFIVSVGCTTGAAGTTFANSHQERVGTLMHELGHNLGLRHGGGDDDNCKPNLISVMSYARQFPWGSLAATTANGARTEWSPTYSRQDLQDLNENNLQEADGLTITSSQWSGGGFSSFGPGSSTFEIIWGRPAVTYSSNGATVNWDNAAGNTASLNINTLSGMTGCTGTVKSTLASYDEWTLLDLNFRDEGSAIDGLVYPDPDTLAELTPPVLEGAEAASMVGPNNVFNHPGISVLPDVATDAGNNIYVVWSEKPGLFSGNFEILFSRSVDGGATFSPPKVVSNNAGDSLTPRIAVSGGILYVVWSDKTGGTSGNYDIQFSKSSNMGEDWEPSVKLSSNSGDSLTPSLAVSGSSIYVVWSDKTGGTSGNYDIQFKKSTNGGVSFTPNTVSGTKVSSNGGDSLTPDVDVSPSGIFVVWSDISGGTSGKFDILFKKSTDGGTTFLPNTANAKNISTNSGHSLTPSLAVDGDNVYVTWSDTTGGTSGNFDILFKKSVDGGTNFTPNTANAKNISTTSSLSATPRIAVSGGSIYIAWSDIGTPNQFDIFVKKSGDSGENFEAAVNISDNSGQSITPAIALTDGPHLVWGDLTPGITGDIMYASRII